ncbi:MAG: choline dehydrogenase-like flavoprotein [Planctomycetota bacterium]|jgi:choline dehydrogenase-like flavoprotein
MIHDLDAHGQTDLEGYDLCIIGSGPAGATLATELLGSGLKICVLESGLRRRSRHADSLREVTSTGIHIKEYSRERLLGGASTTWAGLSSPFDPVDFEARTGIPNSGWPITREELLPFYEAAAERYRFPVAAHFSPDGFRSLRPKGDLQPEWTDVNEKVFMAAADPQNFGKECEHTYTSDAAGLDNVDLFFDASVTQLLAEPDTQRVAVALARTKSGKQVRVHARAFVVAAGGIENARILLNSRDMCPAGLGNEEDRVGRYFMNHPKNYLGWLHFDPPVLELPYYFGCMYKGYAGYAGLRLPEDELRERGLLNSYVRLEPIFPWTDNPGIEALVLFVKRSSVLFAFWKKRKQDELVELRDYSETGDDSDLQNKDKGWAEWLGLLGTVIWNAPRVLQYLSYRLTRRKPRIKKARARNFMEMEPHEDNRVVLGEDTDTFDSQLPHVQHACTELDQRSLLALHERLAKSAHDAGLGRFESTLAETTPWPIDQDASHHMGATRMGADPKSSVTNPDGRLHTVDNVYLAGASILPTSGCANPTFTLVALAIRQAQTLRETLR